MHKWGYGMADRVTSETYHATSDRTLLVKKLADLRSFGRCWLKCKYSTKRASIVYGCKWRALRYHANWASD